MGRGRRKPSNVRVLSAALAMLAIGGCASDEQTSRTGWAGLESALGFTHTISCDSTALAGLADTRAAQRADPEIMRQARAEVESNCTPAEPG